LKHIAADLRLPLEFMYMNGWRKAETLGLTADLVTSRQARCA
jgi:hypothetical protein